MFTFTPIFCKIKMVNHMSKLLDFLKSDNKVLRITLFLIGVFIASLIYNLFFVPNNIVVGGVSGLAIIVKKLFGVNTTTFINISNIILIVICFLVLGKKGTLPQIFGSITYSVMVSLTAPIAKMINLNFESILLALLIASLFYGVANGLIYRAGFSTGGSDIVAFILESKLKKPITYINPIMHNTIIIFSGIVFSPVKVMYAVMIIFISNKITNSILFGISSNKMVYVISKKSKQIENYIMNEIHTGATEMRVHSGLFEKKKQMLFCVVHNSQYPKFKQNIIELDPNAFVLAKDCYEVSGGRKYEILPF